MSQTVIFEIGAVVFVAVTAAVFLYGMSLFQEWQEHDDTRAGVGLLVDTPSNESAARTKDESPRKIVPIDRAPSSGSARPLSAA